MNPSAEASLERKTQANSTAQSGKHVRVTDADLLMKRTWQLLELISESA
jgi:hypothetical protein